MNSKKFMDYARDRVIGTAFEIDGSISSMITFVGQLVPFCICSFNDTGITLYKKGALFKKKGKVIREISFKEIARAEISASRKIGGMGIPRNYYLLDFVICFKNNERLYFDCVELSVIPKIIHIFKEQNIPVIDVYDLETLFGSGEYSEEMYDYLEKNLDQMAEEQGLNPNRQDQMAR